MKKNIERIACWGVVVILVGLLLLSINNFYVLEAKMTQLKGTYEKLIQQQEEQYKELHTQYEEVVGERDKLVNDFKEAGVPRYKFTEDEVYLLAQCVEAEAGYYKNHSLSQRYVTQVILNRLYSSKFPNTLKDVIYQKYNGCPQFSVAYNGSMNRTVQPETLYNVYKVLLHGTDLPEYVCYFYGSGASGNWVTTIPVYKTVEGTTFCYTSKEVY